MKLRYQNLRRRAHQAGLTLIELLVVLVILIGIGGLLLPTINNALTRTHVATCPQNFAEVHQMIQRSLVETGGLGNSFDSGVNTGAAVGGNTSINGANVAALTGEEALALNNAGIDTVLDHDDSVGDYNITFNTGATSRSIAAGGTTAAPTAPTDPNVVTLTPAQAGQVYLSQDTDAKFVWFGIGTNWSLLGTVAPEPPVHFGDTPGFLPHEVYSRFGIVMQLRDDAGELVDPARFVRVTYSLGDTDEDGNADYETSDNHIGIHWQEVDATQ